MDIQELGRKLDRAIAVAAPQWAARRVRARGLMEAGEKARDVVRRFDAASVGRRTAGWNAGAGSMDSEMRPALHRLRYRARDLTSNDVWATSAIEALQTDLVGTGIRWRPKTDAEKPNASIEDRARRLFLPWFESKRCDIRNKQTGYGLQSIAAREMCEAGEFLVRRIWTGESPVPFRLQFLEPDHLDTLKDGWTFNDGHRIVQGVEYDRYSRVVAYWLFRDHPGDFATSLNFTSERVPAGDVLHVFEELRFGQTRGIPRATPCMLRMRSFSEYEDAEEVRKKVLACFVAFVHDLAPEEAAVGAGIGEAGNDPGDPANGVGAVRKFSPGTFQGLPTGKTITFGQPTGDDNYVDFAGITLRGISAAFGPTYERITGDLRGVNFSSGRMGALKYHAILDRLSWLTLIPQLCDGIFDWFLEAMTLMGELNPEQVGSVWTPPRRPLVDPTVEIPALAAGVRAGFQTRSEVVSSLGDDPREVERQFADENRRADELKLSFDSDGRRPLQQPFPPSEGSGKPAAKPTKP